LKKREKERELMEAELKRKEGELKIRERERLQREKIREEMRKEILENKKGAEPITEEENPEEDLVESPEEKEEADLTEHIYCKVLITFNTVKRSSESETK